MKFVMIFAVLPAVLCAHSNGPEPRRTGAPGDNGVSAPFGPTCASCHSGNPGTGAVQISAAEGTTYTPGQKQRMTVMINATPAARVYGFQATARLLSNLSNGQAGTLQPSNNETQVVCEDDRRAPCRDTAPVQFIEHNAAKSTNTFEFDWTPPSDANAGDVRFYVAANAANGNGQDTGDRIFTANITLSAKAAQTSRAVNGASFSPGIVPGSWVTIFGSGFTNGNRIWRNDEIVNGVLPTQLDGVKVSINNKPAAVYYISPAQINVQAPSDSSSGDVNVEVIKSDGSALSFVATLVRTNPGWFMFDPENRRYIAGVHTDGSFIGKANLFGAAVTTVPAKPGETILLFGTGFGPTQPAVEAGRVFSSAAPSSTRLRFASATLTQQCRSPDCPAPVYINLISSSPTYRTVINR